MDVAALGAAAGTFLCCFDVGSAFSGFDVDALSGVDWRLLGLVSEMLSPNSGSDESP